MATIRRSTSAYEAWLRAQLSSDIVAKDLAAKHEKMRESPFSFLRATYWRWAETVLTVCPDLAKAPQVLAVGDVHLENFGTWRDVEGRMVWGVNDFDEAADMPYPLDLVRLATSAMLAPAQGGIRPEAMCADLLHGYRAGLAAPAPVVLDRDSRWLRSLVLVSEKDRKKFWKKIFAAKIETAPDRFHKALAASMPERGIDMQTARRTAGTGSLGRQRWIGFAECWRGGPVVREAKALAPSAWTYVHGPASAKNRCGEIAAGRMRAPDPWFTVTGDIVVRRLSPNNRKIEADSEALAALSGRVLRTMGQEIASLHIGVKDRRKLLLRDLDRRDAGWLLASATAMAAATVKDHQDFASG